jgi:hypothetical protein
MFVNHMTKGAHWRACKKPINALAFGCMFIDNIIRLDRVLQEVESDHNVRFTADTERSCVDPAEKAAHVYGIPSRNRWSLWGLNHDNHMLFASLYNSWQGQLGPLPSIGRVHLQFLFSLLDEADIF